MRAEDSCHASPKLPATDPCDARCPAGFAERGAQTGRARQPPAVAGLGRRLAGRRRWFITTPTRRLWSRPRFAARQFSPCSRRLAVTRVASWLELAGRPNPLRVSPISGTSLTPACNGCESRRRGRGLNRDRASTRSASRLYGVSPGSGVVVLVPVLCRGATVTLRHHSSLAGFVPPRDYAMTLFPLLLPKMTVVVAQGPRRVFRLC